MKIYHVYNLLCSDGMYYTGVTNDLDARLEQHQQGTDPKVFTYKRRLVKLVFNEIFHDIGQAIAFEEQVKGWRREKKEAIIKGNWEKLPELSRIKNDLIKNARRGHPKWFDKLTMTPPPK